MLSLDIENSQEVRNPVLFPYIWWVREFVELVHESALAKPVEHHGQFVFRWEALLQTFGELDDFRRVRPPGLLRGFENQARLRLGIHPILQCPPNASSAGTDSSSPLF